MNYLLVGSEEYLKQQFLNNLKKSLLGDSTEVDFEVFRGGDSEITSVLNSFNTLPFFSKHKIVAIKDIEKFSPKEKNSVLKYLKSPRNSTTLAILSYSREKNKFLQDISKFVKTVRCDRIKEGDIAGWIKKEFTLRGKKISAPLANLVREIVGNDLYLLKNEIEKITTFSGDVSEITEKHVESVLGEGSYKTVFQLVDLVLEKKLDKILLAVEELLTKEKPHQILSLLGWQFRNFLKIKNLPTGASGDDVSRKLGITRYFARRLKERSRLFDKMRLKKNLEIILESDLYIKRGILKPNHALERALVLLCR